MFTDEFTASFLIFYDFGYFLKMMEKIESILTRVRNPIPNDQNFSIFLKLQNCIETLHSIKIKSNVVLFNHLHEKKWAMFCTKESLLEAVRSRLFFKKFQHNNTSAKQPNSCCISCQKI